MLFVNKKHGHLFHGNEGYHYYKRELYVKIVGSHCIWGSREKMQSFKGIKETCRHPPPPPPSFPPPLGRPSVVFVRNWEFHVTQFVPKLEDLENAFTVIHRFN